MEFGGISHHHSLHMHPLPVKYKSCQTWLNKIDAARKSEINDASTADVKLLAEYQNSASMANMRFVVGKSKWYIKSRHEIC